MSENHFWSHFYPLHIDTQLFHFRSHFWPFQIDLPFWISEIHFRSQFWPFHFNLFFGSHIGCLKITLDRISGHFRLIGHFGCPKFTFDGISGHFKSIRFGLVCWSLTSLCHSNVHIETMSTWEMNPFTALTRIRSQFLRTQWPTSNHQRVDTTTPQTAQSSGLAQIHTEHFYFWQTCRHRPFWCPQITFDRISGHFRSIWNFFFNFWQNGRRRPFWKGRQCQLSNLSEIFWWVMHVSNLKNVVQILQKLSRWQRHCDAAHAADPDAAAAALLTKT